MLEVITYGGIVARLLAPDRDGKIADVVLGFDNLDPYLAGHPFFGATAGRVAGRITGARFRLDGKLYELSCNEPPNHLHGGVHGFDKKLWRATPGNGLEGAPALRLAYRSPDGEEGYPGTVDVSITYTVTNDNSFVIETEAVTDRPTPLSLTHHSYFNLAGEAAGSIVDHELEIYADEFVPNDDGMALLGRLEPVDNCHDFRHRRRLGAAIPLLFKNHGCLYAVRQPAADNPGRTPVLAARLTHPGSGRTLSVSTTEQYLQLYTGSGLDGSYVGKSGLRYERYAGVCLECEGYPDGANAPHLGDIILRPGRTLRQITAYTFSA